MSEPEAPTASRKKTPKRVSFREVEGPLLAQAVGLCLGILKYVGFDTWADLAHATQDHDNPAWEPHRRKLANLELSEHQTRLLAQHEPVLRLLRLNPVTSVAICPECFNAKDGYARTDDGEPGPLRGAHGWSLVAHAAPTKCKVTAGCTGKPYKVGVTARN